MKYSVIIPTCCVGDYVFGCVSSALQDLGFNGDDFEIIVVENGSKRVKVNNPYVRLFQFNTRLGFPKAVNIGMFEAKGEWLIIVNDDAVLPAGWLNAIVPQNKKILCGVKGATLVANHPHKRYEHSSFVDGCVIDKPVAVDYCGMQLFCLHRDAFDIIGNLDERFGIGYCEDADYGIRARDFGFKSMVVPLKNFQHVEHATTSSSAEAYEVAIDRGFERLYRKYHASK